MPTGTPMLLKLRSMCRFFTLKFVRFTLVWDINRFLGRIGNVVGFRHSCSEPLLYIHAGSFKGFALLRQATRPANGRNGYPAFTEPRPVYAPGQVTCAYCLYGIVRTDSYAVVTNSA